jgi:hypothetical protein
MTASPGQTVLMGKLHQLELTKTLLLERLERVLTALSLTLDAEAAIEEQLAAISSEPTVAAARVARGHETSASGYRRLLLQLRETHPSG